MPWIVGQLVDDVLAEFIADVGQRLNAQSTQVFGRIDVIEIFEIVFLFHQTVFCARTLHHAALDGGGKKGNGVHTLSASDVEDIFRWGTVFCPSASADLSNHLLNQAKLAQIY